MKIQCKQRHDDTKKNRQSEIKKYICCFSSTGNLFVLETESKCVCYVGDDDKLCV